MGWLNYPASTGASGVPADVQQAIDDAVAALVDSSPGVLDTLNELAAALGDDAAFSATMTTALAGKQASLGFTAENVANKDTDVALTANSDTKYASQKAAKAYADAITAAFVAADKILPILSTETNDYTVVAADAGGRTIANKASAISFTFNSSTGWSVGQVGEFPNIGAGQLTIVQGSGSTLRAPAGLKSRVQYSCIRASCIASNEYLIDGDTTT